MTDDKLRPVPQKTLRAAHLTLYRALVFCRNYSANKDASQEVVYDLMDALHEIPQILNAWGTSDNDVEKLRRYFGCFDHNRWRDVSEFLRAPDLVQVFDQAIEDA